MTKSTETRVKETLFGLGVACAIALGTMIFFLIFLAGVGYYVLKHTENFLKNNRRKNARLKMRLVIPNPSLNDSGGQQ